MFDSFFICTVCHEPLDKEKVVSYSNSLEGRGTVTKACCIKCSEETHEKWVNSGWQKHCTQNNGEV